MSYFVACVLVFAATYLLNITYITVFYHRGLTHGAVKLSPWTRKLVVATGNWVTGLDPKGWSCMHRLHHQYSDTAKDPHSPANAGIFGVMLAQLHAYNGVLRQLKRKDPAMLRLGQDLDFPVHWLNTKKVWYLPYLAHVAVVLVLGFGFHAWLMGYAYFAGMMSHPIQGWLVNAFGHSHGYRNYEMSDHSRNNTLVAWFVMGEGYQNNHHRFPRSPRFSVRWFELDMGYGLCLVLQFLGMVSIESIGESQELPMEMAAKSY